MKHVINNNKTFLIIAVAFLTAFSWLKGIDTRSTAYVDGAVVQSTAAFAVARGLNAIISTVQSTQVSFALAGGVSVTVGEVLDPLNDLVEQYSSLMKVSIVSLIIQKLLIEITTDTFFKIAITVTGSLLIAALLFLGPAFQMWLMRVFCSLVFIRFILVFTVLANGVFDTAFLYKQTDKNMTALVALTEEHAIDANTPALSEERTAELSVRYDMNTQTLANLAQAQDSLMAIKNQVLGEIASIDSELTEARAEIELLDRVFRRDENVQALELRRGAYQRHLKATEDQLRVIERHQSSIEQENLTVALELQGLPTDWLGRTGRWFSDGRSSVASTLDLARIQTIKKKLDDSVEGILRLMALFIFKTLISPLLFMAALMWGAKQIWNVNLRDLFDHEIRLRPGT